MKKESYLYSGLAGGTVRCGTCRRMCVVPEGKRGWCRTRVNEGGKLYTEIYGEVSTCSVNPIEKKADAGFSKLRSNLEASHPLRASCALSSVSLRVSPSVFPFFKR